MKKSQITIFIIIGIVILISASVLFFLKNTTQEKVIGESTELSTQLPDSPEKFENFIQSCIQTKVQSLIPEFSIRGGTLREILSRKYDNISYNYFCINNPKQGCVNELITRPVIEHEISQELLKSLPTCINLEVLKKEGYQIESGNMNVETDIGSDVVTVTLNYPFKISNDEATFQQDKFLVSLKSNFGMLYDLAVKITNDEIEKGRFDKEAWMTEYGASIEVFKHKPYPDTVYELKNFNPANREFLTFRFAVQGEDTITKVDFGAMNNDKLGYCYTEKDNNCFNNAVEDDCRNKGGVYYTQKPAKCGGISTYDAGCNGTCLDCGSHKHGESWCEYDGPVGNGLDYVGSRHFLRSCFNGVIYYEECRDFREEICVEDGPTATCRPNRWQDCVVQTNQKSCLDDSKRDCYWDSELKKSYVSGYGNKRCFPAVPPGFRHWMGNGIKVCQMANEQNDCDGMKCPQLWVDSAAVYCSSMGDCGAWRNIADIKGTEGFINTNSKARNYTLLEDGLTKKGQDYSLRLRMDADPLQVNSDLYVNPQNNFEQLLKRTADYVEETTKWSMESFLWQYLTEGAIDYYTRHTAFCSVWVAPKDSRCELCSKEPNKPCSEYRCYSLGQGCYYEEKDGIGICKMYDKYLTGNKPPRIEVDTTKLSANLTVEKDYFLNYNGWSIQESVSPNKLVSFGIKSDQEVQCSISLFPGYEAFSIPITRTNFSKEHDFKMRIPDLDMVVESVKDYTGILSLLPLTKLEEFESIFKKMEGDMHKTASNFGMDTSKLDSEIKEYEDRYYNEVKPRVKDAFQLATNAVQGIVTELESRKLVVFVRCRDRTLKGNYQEVFFKFNVTEDSEAPKLIGEDNKVEGDTAKLHFMIDEAAECRGSINEDEDYDKMNETMTCQISFDKSNQFYYDCSKDTPFIAPEMTVYTKCADKIPTIKNYVLTIAKSANDSIVAQYPEMIQIIDSKVNISSDYVMAGNDTVINSASDELDIYINFRRKMACKYVVGNSTQENMACSNDRCKFKVAVANETVNIGCISSLQQNRNVNADPFVFVLKK